MNEQIEITKKIKDLPFWQVVATETGKERVLATCGSPELAEFVQTAIVRAIGLGVAHIPPECQPIEVSRDGIVRAKLWLDKVYPTRGDGCWSLEFIQECGRGWHSQVENRAHVMQALEATR